MAARRLLAKWGADALKPELVDGVWRKPRISAKAAAELRKEFRASGEAWPVPEEPKKDSLYGFGLKRRPKGHKADKLREERKADIQENLKQMPKWIAEYRASRKLQDTSLLDKLLLTPKERRMKQFRGQ